MIIGKYFELKEFIPPAILNKRGNSSIQLLDKRIVIVADLLRELTDSPIVINGKLNNQIYTESGLRSFNTSTGSLFSQHKFGRAVDCKVINWKAEDVRNLIRENWLLFKETGLTTIEKDTPTWVHLDCRWTNLEYLYEVPFI